MNERIKQLAEQAFNEANNGSINNIKIPKEFVEKFAELIVRECANLLMKPEYVMNHPEELTDYNRGWVNGRLLGIEQIKEHFGVKNDR